MKTIFIVLLLTITSFTINAQAFGDLTFGEGEKASIQKMEKLGFVKSAYEDREKKGLVFLVFDGKISFVETTGILIFTNDKLAKIGMVIKTDKSNLFTYFDKMESKLVEKYGQGEKVEDYIYPFSKGDGYEFTALQSDNATIRHYFELDNVFIDLSINSDLQTNLQYEHDLWQEYCKKTDEMNSL